MSTANDDLNKRVTERIQDQLLMIMPEEDIRTRVDAVVDNFFSSEQDRYGNRSISSFAKLVNAHLEKRAQEVIKAVFDSPEWKVTVDDKLQVTIGTALQKVLNISPDALADAVALEMAKRRATHLTTLLVNGMMQSGAVDYNIGTTIMNNVLSQINTIR